VFGEIRPLRKGIFITSNSYWRQCVRGLRCSDKLRKRDIDIEGASISAPLDRQRIVAPADSTQAMLQSTSTPDKSRPIIPNRIVISPLDMDRILNCQQMIVRKPDHHGPEAAALAQQTAAVSKTNERAIHTTLLTWAARSTSLDRCFRDVLRSPREPERWC